MCMFVVDIDIDIDIYDGSCVYMWKESRCQYMLC